MPALIAGYILQLQFLELQSVGQFLNMLEHGKDDFIDRSNVIKIQGGYKKESSRPLVFTVNKARLLSESISNDKSIFENYLEKLYFSLFIA